MLTRSLAAGFRRSFACASVSLATVAMASAAYAEGPTMAENAPQVVVRNDLNPNASPPSGVLDNAVDITGVGQMRSVTDLAARSGFVCTGTLINPRTVIFAAHCVNDQDANTYGYNTGGTPISFGFKSNNLTARRLWAGVSADGTQILPIDGNTFQTNTANAIYSVENIWYDPRSLEPDNIGFLNSDIAIATLDTPASDIPTWAMLFTPLTGPTHGLVNGYGTFGTSTNPNQGLDSRRRLAENMIDFLGSLDDRDNFLFCPDPSCPFTTVPQSLYQLDFDDPAGDGAFDPAAGKFDFDVFDGSALPREGTTAGGDSGGPLIVDQKYAKPVVAGVLSGGSRFFGPQPFSSYGTTSFYQPLFLYWDLIVANNPYKYATNIAGDRNWNNPAHWVQTMDPSYAVDRNGTLVNALPGSLGLETSSNTTKFGSVCFIDDCLDITQTGPENAGTGAGLVVPGGPGSKNFVPNNVVSNPGAGVAGRYYDVTLSAFGRTSVTSAITIDRLTIDGATKLDVRSNGNLTVLGDYTQALGALNVDGVLKTGEAFIGIGTLTGSGKIDPTYLTIAKGLVAPGDVGTIGTLTVQGDLILSSGTLLQIDVNRNGADKIAVIGDAQNPGIASVDGIVLFGRAGGAAPRDGQTFKIVTATGGVQGKFDFALGGLGVLRPQLTYNANDVTAKLKAGSLFSFLQDASASASALAFAGALDQLRVSSYNSLSDVYGAIDLMEPLALAHSLDAFTPRNLNNAFDMTGRQTATIRSLVSDRLSILGTARGATGRFTIIGAPETLGLATGQTQLSGSSASQLSFARRYAPSQTSYGKLPESMSGFISGGYENASGRRLSDTGRTSEQVSWHMAMGLEMEAAPNLTVGSAFGIVRGRDGISGSRAEADTSQAIGYGSYRLGGGAYVAGLASVSYSAIGLQRGVGLALDNATVTGATRAMVYDVQAETGIELPLVKGIAFTPRASLRYSASKLSGYRERGGNASLLIDDYTASRLEARLGAKLAGATALGAGWSFAPQLSADMVKAVAGNNGLVNVRFANAAGLGFSLPAFASDDSWSEVRGGVTFANGPLSFGAAVQSDIGRSDYRDNRAVADVTLRF